MNLSDEVRRISHDMGITLSEVARRTEQSPANLSKKMNKNTLSFEDFEKILRALGVEMECAFHQPGETGNVRGGLDDRGRAQIEILQKELETEQLKNGYFTNMGFALRTEFETVTNSLELIKRHRDDQKYIDSCIVRMETAINNIMNLIDNDPISSSDRVQAVKAGSAFKQGMRVLVVDDNEINRGIVGELLADSGIEADEAEDGRQAVALISNAPANFYDLVLMDIQMPVMNGLEAAYAIRSLQGPNSRVPIAAMTASVSDDERRRAEEAGMNTFIEKPLNIKKIMALLKNAGGRME